MSEYLQFFSSHLELSIALVVILLLILWEEWGGRRLRGVGISPETLVEMMNHQNATIVDIRTEACFKKGHIIKAMNLPATTLAENIKKLIKYKQSTLIVVDDNGKDAPSALTLLKKNGFHSLHMLSGGLATWEKAGLPLTGTTR